MSHTIGLTLDVTDVSSRIDKIMKIEEKNHEENPTDGIIKEIRDQLTKIKDGIDIVQTQRDKTNI